jgi:hypothetical protein
MQVRSVLLLILAALTLTGFCAEKSAGSITQLSISFDVTSKPITRAVAKFDDALKASGMSLKKYPDFTFSTQPDVIVVTRDKIHSLPISSTAIRFDGILTEGYGYQRINNRLVIVAVDEVGAMYGLLDLADGIVLRGMFQIPEDRIHNPTMVYRIVKFNLPWSPYRHSEATSVHTQVCRDLQYWEKFLDMMVDNRLNVLSLWNNHPFPYMIRSRSFPKATPFTDDELAVWTDFWKQLFRMAKERGIQTFIVNWNIVVSPEFAAAYGAREYNDLSEQVKQYTRESVTQVINTYEDLTGIGVTLADWMGTFDEKMTPQQREDWINETFVAGIKAADREVKFIHRSVLAGDPLAMRRVIDEAEFSHEALVEIKFNWSHGHSTPKLAITHDYHSGKLDERFWTPMPSSYKIQWMIRNEDFFILRWGQPDFIRAHMAVNSKPYVNGYFIGSEGYIPALDYSHRPSAERTWEYAFEKQWLFYKVWGRLLYDKDTPDDFFAGAFARRYGSRVGIPLLEAYKLAGNVPLRLASFHRSTWDYTLYAEGFIEAEPSSPDGKFDRSSPFISIDEFIDHETLDPAMLSIPEYISHITKGDIPADAITPPELAEKSERDAVNTLVIIDSLRKGATPFSGALKSELDDLATWSYLGLYFADKLRAGAALEQYRRTGKLSEKQEAVRFLERCLAHWDQVVALTRDRYLPTPHVSTQHYGKEYQLFSWELMRPQVVRDIEIARSAPTDK